MFMLLESQFSSTMPYLCNERVLAYVIGSEKETLWSKSKNGYVEIESSSSLS